MTLTELQVQSSRLIRKVQKLQINEEDKKDLCNTISIYRQMLESTWLMMMNANDIVDKITNDSTSQILCLFRDHIAKIFNEPDRYK